MAIPTDFAGLVAWHEGDSQTETDYTTVSALLGLGGTPNGQTQSTSSKRPLIVPYSGGHRAYRFDDVDDVLSLALSTSITARPLTVFVVYSPLTSEAGKRVVTGDSGAHNWLIGPRTEGGDGSLRYQSYVGGFIPGSAASPGDIKVHTVRQKTSGTLAEYWINGVSQGTSSSTNVPGVLSLGAGGGFNEPAYSDVFAIVAYNVDLADADRAAIETYLSKWAGATNTLSGQILTQEAIEVVRGGSANIDLTQAVIEAVRGGTPNIDLSQLVIEVVTARNNTSPSAAAAIPWKRTGTKVAVGTNVDKMTISFFPTAGALLQGVPWQQAVAQGALDGAKIVVERAALVDWADALSAPQKDSGTPVGSTIIFSGRVSEADPSRNQINIEVTSDMELLNVQMPRNVFQPGCMHTLFDSGCTLAKAAFAVSGVVTAGSTTRQVAASALSDADGYYDLGTVEFTSGALAGVKRTVKSWTNSTKLFQFSLPLPVAPSNGDTFKAYPGCDKTKATCSSKFSNSTHFRGFPFIPAAETAH